MALRAVTRRADNSLAWELGEMLSRQLDSRFVFIRNISGRGLGYVDAALVSEHGALVLRVTARRGEFFNEGGSWQRRARHQSWQSMRWNPTREVVASALRVKALCKEHGLGAAPVFAAVVFMRDAPQTRLLLQQPAVPVLHASQFVSGLRDSYFASTRLDARAAQHMVDLLYQRE